MAVGIDTRRDGGDDADDSPAFPTSLCHRIQPQEGVGTGVERTGAETIDERIELFGEFGNLTPAHAFHTKGSHQSIEPAC